MKPAGFKWYHWLFLCVYAVYMTWSGLDMILHGSAPCSRFYAVDNVFLRLLGAATVFFAFAPFSGKTWAFQGAMSVLLVTVLETLITFDPFSFPFASPNLSWTAIVFTVVLKNGPPMLVLSWLSNVVRHTARRPAIEASSARENEDGAPVPSPPSLLRNRPPSVLFAILILVLAAAGPFWCGIAGLEQWVLFVVVPVSFLCSALVVACLVLLWNRASRSSLWMWVTTIIAVVGLASTIRTPATLWTVGFAWNVKLTKNPHAIQAWATEMLDEYNRGDLALSTNNHTGILLSDRISESLIPSFIQEAWSPAPDIGIATIDEYGYIICTRREWEAKAPECPYPAGTTNCVMISWYLHGIIVGTPDFVPKWNPWFSHEIRPGMYAYCGIK